MISQYDAIFKSILSHKKSTFVEVITGLPKGEARPNDAGWYTARTVDYFAELNSNLYVHIEVQTANDPTMHWRMVNYYTLLHHKVHEWQSQDVVIEQYLLYIGTDYDKMLTSNSHFGVPYSYKTINLGKTARASLPSSKYSGDAILSLLMADVTADDWIGVCNRICNMRSEAHKLEALFMLIQLAGLREMREMIENRIEEIGMYEALKTTKLTAWATRQAEVAVYVDLISDFYLDREQPVLTDEEVSMLSSQEPRYLKKIYKMISQHDAPRSYLFAAAVLGAGSSGIGP